MALYDHRVFKQDQNWWVAQVHGQNSAVTTGPAAQGPMTQDFVFFTSLTSDSSNSKVAFIPTGKLNFMSHRSIIRILEAAEDFRSRREMEPYNVPDKAEYAGWNAMTDEEGLRWVFRKNRIQKVPGYLQPFSTLDIICLDDSALRRSVLFQDSDTYDAFVRTLGTAGDEELIKYVKSTFDEVEPEPVTSGWGPGTGAGGWQPPTATDARVREWMQSKGMPVSFTHYDFSREVYAWRHQGPSGTFTLRISQETLEDWPGAELVAQLNKMKVDEVMRADPTAYVLVRRKGAELTVDKCDFPLVNSR